MTEYSTAINPPHRVEQTIIYSPELNAQGVYGNCFQAAVASALGMPLNAVPHFVAFAEWDKALELFLRGVGLTWREEPATDFPATPHPPCIVSGKSPRGVMHSVVAFGDGEVWDPHPSHAGLVDVQYVGWFDPRIEAVAS